MTEQSAKNIPNSLPRLTANLLVVDDEPELLHEVVEYLRRRGGTVLQARGYREAAHILEAGTQPVDALITDGRMPDGSGLDLIRATLRRRGEDFPCILITGHIYQNEGGEDLERQGVKFITKPFSLSLLHREVIAAIDRRGGKAG
jgi:two-component system response regulator PilR (NtrC family)